jgi:hypothetical protein
MALNDQGHSKGFAFVEFEEEASYPRAFVPAAIHPHLRNMPSPHWMQITTSSKSGE